MNEHPFEADMTRSARVAGTTDALRERVYRTNRGTVRVRADWSAMASDEPAVRVPLVVTDERANGHARDLPAFVELFFHDAFLLFNIAAPGSFGGVIATTGGEFRVHELTLDARLFERVQGAEALSPSDVVKWYDALQIGTKQIAAGGVEQVLFRLLHLARGEENDTLSVLLLAQCLEALQLESEKLFALRDAICHGSAPVVHPMHDELFDERLDDEAFEAIDDAATMIVKALQQQVRGR